MTAATPQSCAASCSRGSAPAAVPQHHPASARASPAAQQLRPSGSGPLGPARPSQMQRSEARALQQAKSLLAGNFQEPGHSLCPQAALCHSCLSAGHPEKPLRLYAGPLQSSQVSTWLRVGTDRAMESLLPGVISSHTAEPTEQGQPLPGKLQVPRA